MGMKATQSTEARPAANAEGGKIGNPDPQGSADDDVTHVPAAVGQNTNLSLGLQG
jgi:hypothetical protein